MTTAPITDVTEATAATDEDGLNMAVGLGDGVSFAARRTGYVAVARC
jgi:hypothetical protein